MSVEESAARIEESRRVKPIVESVRITVTILQCWLAIYLVTKVDPGHEWISIGFITLVVCFAVMSVISLLYPDTSRPFLPDLSFWFYKPTQQQYVELMRFTALSFDEVLRKQIDDVLQIEKMKKGKVSENDRRKLDEVRKAIVQRIKKMPGVYYTPLSTFDRQQD